jgi:hypothetical protein
LPDKIAFDPAKRAETLPILVTRGVRRHDLRSDRCSPRPWRNNWSGDGSDANEEGTMDVNVRLAMQFITDDDFPKDEEGMELALAHMREAWHFAKRLSAAKLETREDQEDERTPG